jgi:hypothetical protein
MVEIEVVPGGRIMAWIRESGELFGVTLLLDSGQGFSYSCQEGHNDFPSAYEPARLFAWARERWPAEFATEFAPVEPRHADEAA